MIPVGIAFASASRQRAQAVRVVGVPRQRSYETPGLAYLTRHGENR